ncbi:hypothetical protein CmeUKMEL1_07725 [Cryptosporidium meleagridis]|uniref:Uncharacterized protein n=1 Tax=Cryptosporidium meleagridis TaxID=93969 RepID=A0A2P4Z089_9CRYT|nr:hypothetical protein CmeUKMEL1_07725 [Cryptosporidium meleagridis]
MSEQSNVQAVQPEQAQQIAGAQAQIGMNAGVASTGVPYSSGVGQNMVFQSMAGGSGYFFPPNGSAPMSMGSGAFASVGMPGMYEIDPNMLSGGYSAPYGSAMGSSFYLPNQYGGSGIMTMPYTYDPYGLINPGIIPPVATKIAKKKRSGCC